MAIAIPTACRSLALAAVYSARHAEPLPLLFFSAADEFANDGSRYNPAVMSFIRDEWIYQQMRERCVPRLSGRPLWSACKCMKSPYDWGW